jgi:hypothetical protein
MAALLNTSVGVLYFDLMLTTNDPFITATFDMETIPKHIYRLGKKYSTKPQIQQYDARFQNFNVTV